MTIEKQAQNGIISLFWTGGWDSTFRLLQLVLIEHKKVQPIYLIDTVRASLRNEILTMEKILAELQRKNKEARELILSVEFVQVTEIQSNSMVSEAYRNLKKKMDIGSQYEWLAWYCVEKKKVNVELCIEKGEGMGGLDLIQFMDKVKLNGCDTYLINPAISDKDIKGVYSFFSFPLMDTTKHDMLNVARENDFEEILNKTWFCHRPVNGLYPCGICNPCIQTMNKGFRYRFPLRSRIKYKLRFILSKDQFKLKFPFVYKTLKKLIG